MCPEDGQAPPQLDANELNHFLTLLQLEIDKFNNFFIDKEEEYVIKWKVTNYPHTFLSRFSSIFSCFGLLYQHWFDKLLNKRKENNDVELI